MIRTGYIETSWKGPKVAGCPKSLVSGDVGNRAGSPLINPAGCPVSSQLHREDRASSPQVPLRHPAGASRRESANLAQREVRHRGRRVPPVPRLRGPGFAAASAYASAEGAISRTRGARQRRRSEPAAASHLRRSRFRISSMENEIPCPGDSNRSATRSDPSAYCNVAPSAGSITQICAIPIRA